MGIYRVYRAMGYIGLRALRSGHEYSLNDPAGQVPAR